MKKIFFMLLCFCATGFAQAQFGYLTEPTEKGWSHVMGDGQMIHPSRLGIIKETTNHIISLEPKFKMICRAKNTQKIIWTWDIETQTRGVNYDYYALRLGRKYFYTSITAPFKVDINSRQKRTYHVPNAIKDFNSEVTNAKRYTELYINDTTGELKFVIGNKSIGWKVTWQGTPKD